MEPYAERPQSYFGVSPGFLDRLKSILRPVAYSFAGLLVSRRLIAAFPIGKKAISQLQNMGIDNSRIFPFGYFVDRLSINPHKNSYPKKTSLKLIFVGSLISRKGLVTLFKAIKICHENNVNVSLDVYGPGDPNIFKEIPKNVSFEGSVNFGEAQRVIKEYDILVLPSLHDGWGVVVNEALLQGVPVIVSDAAGASTLVEKSGAGCVFRVGDEKDLADKISYLVHSPHLRNQWASNAMNFKEKISTKIAAQYLYACLQFATGSKKDKPVSPWYI
jgi:glycosyltransferase involved in cell wall biosynthesis